MTFAEEMPTDPKSIKQRAIDIIANAEDEIGQQELLLALHQQLSLEDSIELGRSLRDHQASAPKSSWIGNLQDAAGCLVVPLVFVVIFAAMPFLFSIGERFLKSPARSVAEGVIQTIEFEETVAEDFTGEQCRVYYDYIEIEKGGNRVLIPRERVKSLELDGD